MFLLKGPLNDFWYSTSLNNLERNSHIQSSYESFFLNGISLCTYLTTTLIQHLVEYNTLVFQTDLCKTKAINQSVQHKNVCVPCVRWVSPGIAVKGVQHFFGSFTSTFSASVDPLPTTPSLLLGGLHLLQHSFPRCFSADSKLHLEMNQLLCDDFQASPQL